MRTLVAIVITLLMYGAPSPAVAADGQILGLADGLDELELYKSPEDEDVALTLGRGDLKVPTPVLGVSDNGMFKLGHNGGEYWVISDDVKTDMQRKVDAGCEPKVAGTIVAHGKRGAGEGCK